MAHLYAYLYQMLQYSPYLFKASSTFRVALLVDLSTALFAHAWFRKYEPRDIKNCLTQLSFFAIVPIATLPSPRVNGLLHLVIFLAFLLGSITLYRIAPVHPLAKYPGPVRCKITKLWAAWLTYRGKKHLYYYELHKKYGPIIRIGPNELSVTDAELIPNILGQQGMPKGQQWDGNMLHSGHILKGVGPSVIHVRDYNLHARLRKPWNRAFALNALGDYEESLFACGTELIELLSSICNNGKDGIGHTDISLLITYWSFDFMGEMAFGESFHLMRDGDKNGYLDSLAAAVEIPAITQMIPWASAFFRAIPFWNKEFTKFNAFGVQQAQKCASQITDKKDLFYHLAVNTADIDDDRPPLPMILSDVFLAIVAGSGTTDNVLSGIMFYLLRYPDYLRRLQVVLDLVFPRSEHAVVEVEKFASLVLLNAVINEVMRLQPPIPTGLQRAPAKNSGGKMLGDIFIPEGTGVRVPPYVLHRDSRYFSPNPNQFWPERWYLEDDIVLNRSAFIPFSYGPANCPGKTLAMTGLRYMTAMLLYNFDFWFEDGYDPTQWEKDLRDLFISIKGKLPIKMKRRNF